MLENLRVERRENRVLNREIDREDCKNTLVLLGTAWKIGKNFQNLYLSRKDNGMLEPEREEREAILTFGDGLDEEQRHYKEDGAKLTRGLK